MENDILLTIKHIKEISKKKLTLTKIEAYAKKNKNNDTSSNTESGAMGLVMKDISSLKNFQSTVGKNVLIWREL